MDAGTLEFSFCITNHYTVKYLPWCIINHHTQSTHIPMFRYAKSITFLSWG